MTPLSLSILLQYATAPNDPKNISNSLDQEICAQFCEYGILQTSPVASVATGPQFQITEKGKVYFAGIMAAVSRVPLPEYAIPDNQYSASMYPPLHRDVVASPLARPTPEERAAAKHQKLPAAHLGKS